MFHSTLASHAGGQFITHHASTEPASSSSMLVRPTSVEWPSSARTRAYPQGFAHSQAMLDARDSVKALRAQLESWSQMVNAVKRKVLAAGRWHADTAAAADNPKVVLDPQEVDLLSGHHRRMFESACLQCFEALKLAIPNGGGCPLAPLQRQLITAEIRLFAVMAPITHLSADGAHNLPPARRAGYVQRCLDLVDASHECAQGA